MITTQAAVRNRFAPPIRRPQRVINARNRRIERYLKEKGLSLVEASQRDDVDVSARYIRELADRYLWPHNAHVPPGSETERQIVTARKHSGLSIHEIGLVFRQADINIARICGRHGIE